MRDMTNKEKAACRVLLITQLHVNMDRLIELHEQEIDTSTRRWDTKAAWRRIAKCIELVFIDALEVDELTGRKIK